MITAVMLAGRRATPYCRHRFDTRNSTAHSPTTGHAATGTCNGQAIVPARDNPTPNRPANTPLPASMATARAPSEKPCRRRSKTLVMANNSPESTAIQSGRFCGSGRPRRG